MKTGQKAFVAKRRTSKRVAQCPTCKKWYSSKKSLKIHNRIHTGHKPHWYGKILDSAFDSLLTGLLVFSCNFCPKRFSQANVLKVRPVESLFHICRHVAFV